MCHFSGIEKKETKYGFQYVSKVKGEHGGPYLLIDNFEKLKDDHIIDGKSENPNQQEKDQECRQI